MAAYTPPVREFPSARLREEVRVVRRARVERGRYGNPSAAGPWRLAGVLDGSVREQGGGEQLVEGALEGREGATVWVRADDSLTESLTDADRVVFRGEVWNITGMTEVGFSHRFVELRCSKFPGASADVMAAAALEANTGATLTTLGGVPLEAI